VEKIGLSWFDLIALCHSRGRGDCLANIEMVFTLFPDMRYPEPHIAMFKFILHSMGIGQYA